MLSHLCIAITRNLVEIKHSISHVCSIKVVQKSQSKRFATKLLYKIILFLEYDQSDAPQRQTHKFVLLGGGGGVQSLIQKTPLKRCLWQITSSPILWYHQLHPPCSNML